MPTFLIRKLRHRAANQFVQVYTANGWPCLNSKPYLLYGFEPLPIVSLQESADKMFKYCRIFLFCFSNIVRNNIMLYLIPNPIER